MHRNRLFFPLLLAVAALLLAACTTAPTDGLLATQGFGHFNAKSIQIDRSDGGFAGLREMAAVVGEGVVPIQASGFASGVGSDTHLVVFEASGLPLVTCTNQGGNEAPGQNPAVGTANLGDLEPTSNKKNGRFTFAVNNDDAIGDITLDPGACPNENWSASLDFIEWTDVVLTLEELDTGAVNRLTYECVTEQSPFSIDCTLESNERL